MHKDGAGAGGAGRGEFMATICRGAFEAHLHPIEPGERKRVGSPRAAIANGSLERTAEHHPALSRIRGHGLFHGLPKGAVLVWCSAFF